MCLVTTDVVVLGPQVVTPSRGIQRPIVGVDREIEEKAADKLRDINRRALDQVARRILLAFEGFTSVYLFYEHPVLARGEAHLEDHRPTEVLEALRRRLGHGNKTGDHIASLPDHNATDVGTDGVTFQAQILIAGGIGLDDEQIVPVQCGQRQESLGDRGFKIC